MSSLTREDMDAAFEQFMDTPSQRQMLMIYNAMTAPEADDLRLLLSVAFASGMASAATLMLAARTKETMQWATSAGPTLTGRSPMPMVRCRHGNVCLSPS